MYYRMFENPTRLNGRWGQSMINPGYSLSKTIVVMLGVAAVISLLSNPLYGPQETDNIPLRIDLSYKVSMLQYL